MSAVTTRLAASGDMDMVHAMIAELAAFEGGRVHSTPDDLRRDGGGPHPLFEVLLAEQDGAVVGMLLFLPTYSTWEGRAGVMIHDLFVRAAARGNGIGRTLVEALKDLARQRGCRRVEVLALDWNSAARSFYDAMGLAHVPGWMLHRHTPPV